MEIFKKYIFFTICFVATTQSLADLKLPQYVGKMPKADSDQLSQLSKDIQSLGTVFKELADQTSKANSAFLNAEKQKNYAEMTKQSRLIATGLNGFANVAPLLENITRAFSLVGGSLDEVNMRYVQNIMDTMQNLIAPNIKTLVAVGNDAHRSAQQRYSPDQGASSDQEKYEKKAWQMMQQKNVLGLSKSVTADEVKQAVLQEEAAKNLQKASQVLRPSKK